MNKRIKLTAVLLSLALSLLIVAGCGQADTATTEYLLGDEPQTSAETESFLALQMVPLSAAPAMFHVYNPVARGINVSASELAEVDYSNSRDGYVMIRYLRPTEQRVMVRITGPSGMEYVYFLRTDGQFEVFPLSDGNGSYTIRVFENIEGNRFSQSLSAQINVTLDDEFAPFLRPNQFVNFNSESTAVAKAAELVRDSITLHDKVAAVFTFIIENIEYDFELARTVQSGYVPDIDLVLERGKGICFDYAALMAAMLRSQAIPTRLVTGYAGDVYHAWIDVWSEESGWITQVIYFDGFNWELMDPTFAAAGTDAAIEFMGDGTNYNALRLF